jgi:hypothetical protein
MARTWLLIVVFAVSAARSWAQCTTFDARFHPEGTNGVILAAKVLDLGTGPQLYVAGDFTRIGNVAARNLARWNGSTWEPIGGGANAPVRAIASYDDGSGPKLYIGGDFSKIGALTIFGVAKWDGTAWSSLGTGTQGNVRCMTVFDEGSGPRLMVAGEFATAGNVPNTRRVARWNGTAWSALANGSGGFVRSIAGFDDGSGPKLYVAGVMSAMGNLSANDTPVSNIARWDGTAWSALGSGLNNYALVLEPLDDGTGPALYVGGAFTVAGGVNTDRVARWNANGWSGLGFGLDSEARAISVFDDGTGPALYVGGSFTGASGIVRWLGGQWATIGAPISGEVNALATFDDGGGLRLWAAGSYDKLGGVPAHDIAKWNGTTWSAVSVGQGVFATSQPLGITGHNDGSGPALYVTGPIESAAGNAVGRTIRWNGTAWSTVGTGPIGQTLLSVPTGSLAGLYLAGQQQGVDPIMTNGVAKWDGLAWSRVGNASPGGHGGIVDALVYFDDGTGPAIYAGGQFGDIDLIAAANVVKWNGTAWLSLPVSGRVLDFAVFDDGSGPALYAGKVTQPNVVKLTPTGWQAVGAVSLNGTVQTLAAFDDGAGSKLYVGGTFGAAGPTPILAFARLNGNTWEQVGSGLPTEVYELLVHDDGSGPGLFVGTGFSMNLSSILKWNGLSFADVAAPLYGSNGPSAYRMTVHDDGTGTAVWFTGGFEVTGDVFATGVGALRPCVDPGEPFCFGDGRGPILCPCSNITSDPWSGEGCPNSLGSGAKLSVTGIPSLVADTIVLHGIQMPNASALFFQGTTRVAAGNGAFFGDGKRCAGGTVVRLKVTTNFAGGSNYPDTGDLPVSVKGMLGSAGSRHYQVWYRNAAAFCTASTFNLTNGFTIPWHP